MARKKAQALPRPEPEMWAVRGEIVQETEDAILLDVEGTEHWLPKSQIEYDGERGDVVDVELPDWLAEDKCLVDGEGIHTSPAPTPTDSGAPQDDPGVPDEDTAPGIDANATVDLMLTIVDISENGEWATVQANGGEPCEIGTADFTHDANEINAGDTLLCHVNTLAAMAAGLVGPDANVTDKGVTWLRKDNFERTYPLNDEEKLELGNRMAEAQKRIDDLEDELADIRKDFKGRIEQQQKILSDAAKEFRDGKSEPCQVECNGGAHRVSASSNLLPEQPAGRRCCPASTSTEVKMVLKAMLSQPMAGKSEEEIVATRERAIKALEERGYEVVNTLFTDEWYAPEKMKERGVENIPLCFLAKSLENMSKCHVAYFCKGWEAARGCCIEHDAAKLYGVDIFYEEYPPHVRYKPKS